MKIAAIQKPSKEILDLWMNYLIVALGFTLPISIAANNILLTIIFILWLLAGNFKERWEKIKSNRAAIAILLFFALHFAGLIYSSDTKTGFKEIITREQILLFMPIILSVIQPQFIKRALNAFLYAMFLSEILSYGMYFDLIHIPWHDYAKEPFPTPFVSHLSYSPMAAFAVILLIHRLIYGKEGLWVKGAYLFFLITMSLNISLSGGRAGQIGFIVILLFYIAYQFRSEIKKLLFLLLFSVTAILLVFFFNKPFHDRMMLAYHNVANFKANPHTSVGLRINFALNSWELIKQRPIIGYGTGSFEKEYAAINARLTPKVRTTSQPHNFYALTLVQFGIVGLLALFYIFYSLFKIALKIDDNYRGVRYSLLVLYLTIMLSDSYLLVHYTTLFFAFMAALLFKGEIEDA
ncbi:MAG: O-antigen ligase family protein [Hydrogenimonas sp.]|nr:O-antigen ligase family protein [Hydrogenimonas sp.]